MLSTQHYLLDSSIAKLGEWDKKISTIFPDFSYFFPHFNPQGGQDAHLGSP